jgi:hypothetical protein
MINGCRGYGTSGQRLQRPLGAGGEGQPFMDAWNWIMGYLKSASGGASEEAPVRHTVG